MCRKAFLGSNFYGVSNLASPGFIFPVSNSILFTWLTSGLSKSEPTKDMVSTERDIVPCDIKEAGDRLIPVCPDKLLAQLVPKLSEEVILLRTDGHSLISGTDKMSVADDSNTSPGSDVIGSREEQRGRHIKTLYQLLWIKNLLLRQTSLVVQDCSLYPP
jgi:hypothetical protein